MEEAKEGDRETKVRHLARIGYRHLHGRGGGSSPTPTPTAKVNEAASPELEQLLRRAGTWDVTMTMRPSADAEPIVVAGLVAERTAIGPYLQEIMKPVPGPGVSDFVRIDFLTYNPCRRAGSTCRWTRERPSA